MKIAMEGYIEEDNNIVKKVFNTKNNIFNINSKNNIGYYLNNTFYESLENKDYLKKDTFIQEVSKQTIIAINLHLKTKLTPMQDYIKQENCLLMIMKKTLP